MLFRLTGPLVLLCILVLTQTSLAEPETPAQVPSAAAASESDQAALLKKEQAKTRFLRGLELTQNESWDAALAEFLASRELYPTKVALKNAAISLRQLKRNAEALQMYRELLKDFGGSLTPDEKTTIGEAVQQLEASVGHISVESDQPESTVVVDGQQHGTTPLSAAVLVNAGTHSVRVSKEGFEAYEAQVLVAGGQKKSIKAVLKALRRVGTLVVREADKRTLDVVVDGAVVGKTPLWQGQLAVGTHTVFLSGPDDLGTPPSSATLLHNQTSTLTLRASKLDAAIRIEPIPSNARVDVDGVEVGNGVWEGRLKSGTHKIEVVASGFIPFRSDVLIRPGQREVLSVALDRDLSHPMWSAGFVPHIYLELAGGPAFAASFGGGADAACSRGECSTRDRPFGFLAGARGGYQLTRALGLELYFGYLSLTESMTRRVSALADTTPIATADYSDKSSLRGPLGALSASYHFFDRTPLTARVSVGVTRANGSFENSGTYTGSIVTASGPQTLNQPASVPEKSVSLWIPFVAPEVRFGYRFGPRFAVDLGVALFLMFPPDSPRTGRTTLSRDGERKTPFKEFPGVGSPPLNVQPGVLSLPKENGFGTFFALVPTIAARFDL